MINNSAAAAPSSSSSSSLLQVSPRRRSSSFSSFRISSLGLRGTLFSTTSSSSNNNGGSNGCIDASLLLLSPSSSSQALVDTLRNTARKELLTKHLASQHMGEAIDFIDHVAQYCKLPNADERALRAHEIIHMFCLDSSPRQVNLTSETKLALEQIVQNGSGKLHLFQNSVNEVMRDIKQSDAFRTFLLRHRTENPIPGNSSSNEE